MRVPFHRSSGVRSTLRAAVRRFARSRWPMAAAVIMLGLGIGAGTAVFSFLYQVLFRDTGIMQPGRLVEIYQTTPDRYARRGITLMGGLPFRGMEEQRDRNPALESIAIAANRELGFRIDREEARLVRTVFVSPGYFETLGVRLYQGRPFLKEEEKAGEPAAVIGYRLWTGAFHRDPDVLGRGLFLNGRLCRIVGVAPEAFRGQSLARPADLWVAWGAQKALDLNAAADGTVLARLKTGVSQAQAAVLTAAVGDRYRAGLPPGEQDGTGGHRARPFDLDRAGVLEQQLPRPWLLLAAPLLLLLLACANVTNLHLADLELRRREFVTRAALGASRGRIARQVLGESLALALTGWLLGLALAFPLMSLLRRIPTQKMYASRLEVVLHPQAVLFALVLALSTGLLMGLVPALRASRADLGQALKEASGSVVRGGRFNDVLVAIQFSLALTLVASGFLAARGLDSARSLDLGLKPEGVAGMRLQFTASASDAGAADKVVRLLDRAQSLPGVEVATVSAGFPLENAAVTGIRTEQGGLIAAMVGPRHFATLGVRLMAGREFRRDDDAAGELRIVVNQAAAAEYWPGKDPLGRLLGKYRVIGVVADHAVLTDLPMHRPMGFVYMPGRIGLSPCLLVRCRGNPRALLSSLPRLAKEIDPGAPILRLSTLADHLDGLHHHLLVASGLMWICGLASLGLAMMGIQSLLAFRISLKRREVGLRMALGATRIAVVRHMTARTLAAVIVGLAAGNAGAFFLGRAFRSLVADAAALRPGTLVLSSLLLFAAAVAASAGPTWKAIRTEPASSLRHE